MTHGETNEKLGAESVARPASAAPKEKTATGERATDHMSVGAKRHDPILIRKLFESGEYPYAQHMRTKPYEEHMIALQQELLKAQRWIEESGEKIIVLFEGRDAAGKGGTIKRYMEHRTRVQRAWSRCRSRPSARRRNGSSSATSSSFQPPENSACSTAPGTIAPASNA